eukprot:SAG31_NODE_13067_length_895_cov_1.008794_1_plen_55_part_10
MVTPVWRYPFSCGLDWFAAGRPARHAPWRGATYLARYHPPDTRFLVLLVYTAWSK